MNIDTINIGGYRLTSYKGKSFNLFYVASGRSIDLSKTEFELIREKNSETFCDDVMFAAALIHSS